jgi:FkbM family methyltransferase
MRLASYVKPRRMARTIFGAEIDCDIRDFIQRRIYFFNVYEANLNWFLTERLAPGACFIDVGANIGYFSMLASSLVGETGSVIAVEAAPSTYQLLKANLDRNGCKNVTAHNVAATAAPCQVEIVPLDPKNIGANQIKIGGGASTVQGLPLSDILGETVSKAGVIKIDVEGSEGPILEDILANLDKFPQRLTIVSEISSQSVKYGRQLIEAGFRLYALPNNYSIGYYLVRGYLRRSEEHRFSTMIPVRELTVDYRDYVFEK